MTNEAAKQFHSKMSKAHGTMAEACEKDSPEQVFHKAAQAAHAEACEACEKSAKDEMQKALDAAERERNSAVLVPSRVSAVAPEAPKGTLVLRTGQRQPTAADVPPEFRKLCSVDDGQNSLED